MLFSDKFISMKIQVTLTLMFFWFCRIMLLHFWLFLEKILLSAILYYFFIHLITLNGIPQKQPLEMFYKKRVLENSAKFTGKHLCQSLFFNKVAVWSLQLCWKKRLWYRCFRVNFAKLLRAHFLTENMEVVASVILLSWLWNHVQSQQQKNKVRFVSSLRDGVVWMFRWSR